MSLVATVTRRHGDGSPREAVVDSVVSGFAVVVRWAQGGWEPLYGIDAKGERVSLPATFVLGEDALLALAAVEGKP